MPYSKYHHKTTGLFLILVRICTYPLHFIPIPIHMLHLRTCTGILRTAILDDHWLPRSMPFTALAVPSVLILVWPRLIYHSKTAHHTTCGATGTDLLAEVISSAHLSVQQLYVGTDVNKATSVSRSVPGLDRQAPAPGSRLVERLANAVSSGGCNRW